MSSHNRLSSCSANQSTTPQNNEAFTNMISSMAAFTAAANEFIKSPNAQFERPEQQQQLETLLTCLNQTLNQISASSSATGKKQVNIQELKEYKCSYGHVCATKTCRRCAQRKLCDQEEDEKSKSKLPVPCSRSSIDSEKKTTTPKPSTQTVKSVESKVQEQSKISLSKTSTPKPSAERIKSVENQETELSKISLAQTSKASIPAVSKEKIKSAASVISKDKASDNAEESGTVSSDKDAADVKSEDTPKETKDDVAEDSKDDTGYASDDPGDDKKDETKEEIKDEAKDEEKEETSEENKENVTEENIEEGETGEKGEPEQKDEAGEKDETQDKDEAGEKGDTGEEEGSEGKEEADDKEVTGDAEIEQAKKSKETLKSSKSKEDTDSKNEDMEDLNIVGWEEEEIARQPLQKPPVDDCLCDEAEACYCDRTKVECEVIDPPLKKLLLLKELKKKLTETERNLMELQKEVNRLGRCITPIEVCREPSYSATLYRQIMKSTLSVEQIIQANNPPPFVRRIITKEEHRKYPPIITHFLNQDVTSAIPATPAVPSRMSPLPILPCPGPGGSKPTRSSLSQSPMYNSTQNVSAISNAGNRSSCGNQIFNSSMLPESSQNSRQLSVNFKPPPKCCKNCCDTASDTPSMGPSADGSDALNKNIGK